MGIQDRDPCARKSNARDTRRDGVGDNAIYGNSRSIIHYQYMQGSPAICSFDKSIVAEYYPDQETQIATKYLSEGLLQ